MAITNRYQLGAVYARLISTKEAAVGAISGANEAHRINPEDPRGISGGRVGAALDSTLRLATHNPALTTPAQLSVRAQGARSAALVVT